MDVSEKLVELLRNAKAAMKSENLSCDITGEKLWEQLHYGTVIALN